MFVMFFLIWEQPETIGIVVLMLCPLGTMIYNGGIMLLKCEIRVKKISTSL